jgi:hypothetical protein
MFGNPGPNVLDALVEQTARYFYEREREILNVPVAELSR